MATRGKQKFVNTTSQDNNLKAANIVVESDGELARRRVGEALDHVVDSPVVVLRLDERGHVVDVLPRQVGAPEDAKKQNSTIIVFVSNHLFAISALVLIHVRVLNVVDEVTESGQLCVFGCQVPGLLE